MKRIVLLTTLPCLIIAASHENAAKPGLKTAVKSLNSFCEFVPAGDAVLDGDTSSVMSFYMSKTEVTNAQYAEFLNYLKRTGDVEKLRIAAIDTAKWVSAFPKGYMLPMSRHYHAHTAYANYPVVNISKRAAELYCEWLTTVYDSLSGGQFNPMKFRIPLRVEYLRAARGENHHAVYSWDGTFLRNHKGCFQANFRNIGDELITRDADSDQFEIVTDSKAESLFGDGAQLIAPAATYDPNLFGFYNMNGNVAEMISDGDYAVGGDWNSPGYDIRNESIKDFKEPHPTVGFRVVATNYSR